MILLLLACAPAPDCAEGYTAQADGTCLGAPTEPFSGGSTLDEVLDALRPCEPMAASDRIDADGACVDGACTGMTYAEIDAALGATAAGGSPACVLDYDEEVQATYVHCTWPRGIQAEFKDFDDDGAPDADSLARSLLLEPPYDGATPDGLGLDAGLSCFVDTFGAPDSVELVHDGEHWWPSAFWWRDGSIDLGWSPESGPWDGTPSWMRVYEW